MEDMDKNDRKSISSVETYFDSLLRGKLTDNLFFTEIPAALRRKWKEFAVVDCGSTLHDMDAYSQGNVLVLMFAMPNAKGTKNVKVLSDMESRLNRIIKEADDPHYVISKTRSYSDYDAVNDLFYNVVTINLIVK